MLQYYFGGERGFERTECFLAFGRLNKRDIFLRKIGKGSGEFAVSINKAAIEVCEAQETLDVFDVD